MRARLINLAVLAGTLAVSAVLAELALRMVVELPLQRVLPEVRYDRHPVRRFTLRPNQDAYSYGTRATIDANGLRSNGGSADDLALADTSVIALGDSFTFGLGVEDHETWPAVLERKLNESLDSRVSVLNAGTISYGVFQEFHRLEEILTSANPELVVHGLYWNDFINPEPPALDEPSPVTDQGYFTWDGLNDDDDGGGIKGALRSLSNRSAVLYTVKTMLLQAVTEGEQDSSDYAEAYSKMLSSGLAQSEIDTLRNFYEDLKEAGSRHGFAVFVIVMPIIDLIGPELSEGRPVYAQQATELLSELQLPYIDGFALWDEFGLSRQEFLPQGPDAHLDETGYEVLSDAAASALVAQWNTTLGLGAN